MAKSRRQIAAETKKKLTAGTKKADAAWGRAAKAYENACKREENAHEALQVALNQMRLAALDMVDTNARLALAERAAEQASERLQAFCTGTNGETP